jgi:hypothetical protein
LAAFGVGCFFGAGAWTPWAEDHVVFIIIAAVDGALITSRMQPCVSEGYMIRSVLGVVRSSQVPLGLMAVQSMSEELE